MSESEKILRYSLVRTFGRLKGRALSKNQKLGLNILVEKYNFNLETEQKKKIFGWKLDLGMGNT